MIEHRGSLQRESATSIVTIWIRLFLEPSFGMHKLGQPETLINKLQFKDIVVWHVNFNKVKSGAVATPPNG